LLASLKISDGDLETALEVSEDLYDSAPRFLDQLSNDGLSEWFSPPPSILPYIGDPDVSSVSLN
jgi:hypothetical protein